MAWLPVGIGRTADICLSPGCDRRRTAVGSPADVAAGAADPALIESGDCGACSARRWWLEGWRAGHVPLL